MVPTPDSRAWKIHESLPGSGLFAAKAWRISPEPFPLSRKTVAYLEGLGPLLQRFQKACDHVYRRSRKGSLPGWIAAYLDRGKPRDLLDLGLSGRSVSALPGIIRPDLIFTPDGFAATELDSVPGGIGLTAWLAEVYGSVCPDRDLVGGTRGMKRGFASIFQSQRVDILVSKESAAYRPEMEWLADRLEGDFRVRDAENYSAGVAGVYRFFELFDLPSIPGAEDLGRAAAAGEMELTSPYKPWIEEKMWAALLWSLPLREIWSQELRAANFDRLRSLFPRSWIVDPAPVPPHAAIPGLEIQNFAELTGLGRTERELVLKISGFNEKAWGSRGVTMGHDVPVEEWSRAVGSALAGFETSPYILQRFHAGRKVLHPWLDEATGRIETMEGRVRLCPYYFIAAADGQARLGGVLATICPADKKVIHGMSEAIMTPCCVAD